MTYRIILRKGLSSELKPGVLHTGELGFNTDTNELMVGTPDGTFVKVSDVVVGPDDALYLSAPEGFIPLCIRDPAQILTKKRMPYEGALSAIRWPENSIQIEASDTDKVPFTKNGMRIFLYPDRVDIFATTPQTVQQTIDKLAQEMIDLYQVDTFYVTAKKGGIYYDKHELWAANIILIGRKGDSDYIVLANNNNVLFRQRLAFEQGLKIE